MEIKLDHLNGHEVSELLLEHLQSMRLISPPESVHALDVDGLRKPDVTFWTVWENRELLGCGALKELDKEHGEVKSMRTTSQHLRKGVARRLLEYILDEARAVDIAGSVWRPDRRESLNLPTNFTRPAVLRLVIHSLTMKMILIASL